MSENKTIRKVGGTLPPQFQCMLKLWIILKVHLASLKQASKHSENFDLGKLVSATKHPFTLEYDQRCHER